MPQAEQLLPAYLIVGENELKRDQAVARIKRYIKGSFADFNLDERSHPAELVAADLLNSLNTLPFGGDLRLVIIHGAERLTKESSEALISYLQNPCSTTTLCLVAEKLAKNTRLYKAVSALDIKAVVVCDPIKRKDLPTHVKQLAKTNGVTIDYDAAQELINRLGESPQMLDSQLKTLAAMFGAHHNIDKREITQYVARTAEVKPWEFLDAVCDKNAAQAISLLNIMPEKRYVALLSLLVGRLRELICAKSLDARGERSSITQELGKQSWLEQKYVDWAWRFSEQELAHALVNCAACERTLKGTGDDESAFKKLIILICS